MNRQVVTIKIENTQNTEPTREEEMNIEKVMKIMSEKKTRLR